MINRRRFLQAGAATGVILAMPRWAFPFSQSVLGIKKFAVALPGLIADTDHSGARGIPVLTPVTHGTAGGAPDVYKISAKGFTQRLLNGATNGGVNPDVKLWGYASDAAGAATPQYLGGVIVAVGGKKAQAIPVQLHITNSLPASHKLLPVDITLIDPASREQATANRTDRIAIHNHGAFVFWDSDGGPFHWFSSASPTFVHGSSFINGPTSGAGVGTATYFYPNQQSARFLWYHDHAYGVTRTNAYAGLASGYLITDTLGDGGEMDLINKDVIPGKGLDAFTGLLGIPLIIQDKTFWDPASDPHYNDADIVPGATEGDLWYPHVYEGGLDPSGLPDMSLPPNPTQAGNKNRWGTPDEALSRSVVSSSVPEFFSDTILVNGAPYPVLDVDPKRYRFRLLNASQGRFYNLQLYVGDTSTPDGIKLMRHPDAAEVDPNDNPILIPDPSVNPAGPAFVQIANEGGFLPAPAIFGAADGSNNNSNQVLLYKIAAAARSHGRVADDGRLLRFGGGLVLFPALPGDPTDGNVVAHNLLIAPAERPDVIIDFRGWPAGTEFILYSDAPAPFPGGDTRNDYFVVPDPVAAGLPATWSNDLTSIGGAKQRVGQAPDTRILMKFKLTSKAPSNEPPFDQWLATLKTELPKAFAAVQDPPLDIAGITHIKKALGEDNDEFGRLRQFLGNPSVSLRTYLDFPSEVALEDEVQVWDIYNTTADTHPMHFHLVNVQVIERQQWKFNPDGTPVLPLQPDTTLPKPPVDENEKGWRETVRMNPGEVTTVAMKFTFPQGTAPKNSPRLLASYGINGAEYVWHCHILEHEEHDMMRPIVVIPKG